MNIFDSKWFAQDIIQTRKCINRINYIRKIILILFINFKCGVESQIIKQQHWRLNLNKNILNINNINVINLKKRIDENFIFESKSKKVELTLKKIDDENAYVIV